MPDHAVIVPGESLPTTNTLIPTGIALAIFAPLTVILDIAPLLWHIRNRNVAAISLVAWIMLHNFISFVNLLIWPTDDFKDHYIGEGLCDVEVKFMVARSVAIPAASLCIIRALARVMNTDKGVLRPTRAQRRRAIVMDLVWCIGCPLISMFLHYVVQPNRYFLLGVSGCTPSFWASWLSILLMCLPPLFLSLANSYFAILVLVRLHKYRAIFGTILKSGNTTKSRFFRLFMASFVLTLVLLPIEIYVLTTNVPNHQFDGSFRWNQVHNNETWKTVVLYHSAAFYDRWVDVASGLLVFILYGMGEDAVGMYRTWLLALGFDKLFPSLKKRQAGSTAEGTQRSLACSRTKSSFKSKMSSSLSSGPTLTSGDHTSSTLSHQHLNKPLPSNIAADPFVDPAAPQTPRRTWKSKFAAPFTHISSSRKGNRQAPSSTAAEKYIPMREIHGGAGPSKGTVSTNAWSDTGSSEGLAREGTAGGDVVVSKEIRRGSESV